MAEKRKASSWLKSRFGFEPILREVVLHRVTKTPWYYGGGGALLTLMVVLFVTGSFLALTYSASPDTAYESMMQITLHAKLGWLVRALHYWSAGLMIVFLLYHLFRQILIGGYLPPREGTWLIGVVLFVLVITNSFTGYTLRWDESAIYAMKVPLNILYGVPWIGPELVKLVQGGWELGANALSRIYAVHVIFVPLSMLLLVGFHLYLVVIHGVTTQAEKIVEIHSAEEQIELREHLESSDATGQDFYPRTAFSTNAFGFVVFAIVFGLALTQGAPELGSEGSLLGKTIPREEWWFAWYSALTAYFPPALAPALHLILPIGILLILIALPFIDRSENRGARRRPLAAVSLSLLVIGILALSSLRVHSPWTAWPRDSLPPLPPGIHLSDSAARGQQQFVTYGCSTCHAIGGHGSGFAPNLTGTRHRFSKQELKRIILEPPEDIAMPAYRGRMAEEELDQIADFVLVAQTFPAEFSPDHEGSESR